jgi:hypothetical protein
MIRLFSSMANRNAAPTQPVDFFVTGDPLCGYYAFAMSILCAEAATDATTGTVQELEDTAAMEQDEAAHGSHDTGNRRAS